MIVRSLIIPTLIIFSSSFDFEKVVSYQHDKFCCKIFAPRLAPKMEINMKLETGQERMIGPGEGGLERVNNMKQNMK